MCGKLRGQTRRGIPSIFMSTPSISKARLLLSTLNLEHPQQSKFIMSLRQVTKRKRSPISQCLRAFTSTSSRTQQDNATESVAASQYSTIKANPSANSSSYKSSQLSSQPSRTLLTLAPLASNPPLTHFLTRTCEKPSHQPANQHHYKETDNRKSRTTAQHPSPPKP